MCRSLPTNIAPAVFVLCHPAESLAEVTKPSNDISNRHRGKMNRALHMWACERSSCHHLGKSHLKLRCLQRHVSVRNLNRLAADVLAYASLAGSHVNARSAYGYPSCTVKQLPEKAEQQTNVSATVRPAPTSSWYHLKAKEVNGNYCVTLAT
eukprot:348862-Amphidinium_carterae.1